MNVEAEIERHETGTQVYATIRFNAGCQPDLDTALLTRYVVILNYLGQAARYEAETLCSSFYVPRAQRKGEEKP